MVDEIGYGLSLQSASKDLQLRWSKKSKLYMKEANIG